MKKPVKLELDYKDIKRLNGHRWPYVANSVDEAYIVNLIPFLQPDERIRFMNELWRVLKKDAKAQIVSPHWCSARAHSDLAFVYPPVAEGWYYHLNADWRKANAPWGTKYRCDFDMTFGYGMHPLIVSRNQEYQQNAVTFWKEAAQDLIATVTKK